MPKSLKGAAIYARVSTDSQTTENQVRELREVAERRGWQVVEVYCDNGISGAKGVTNDRHLTSSTRTRPVTASMS